MTFEQWLARNGIDAADVTPAMTAKLKLAYSAETAPVATPATVVNVNQAQPAAQAAPAPARDRDGSPASAGTPFDHAIASAVAEQERVSKITTYVEGALAECRGRFDAARRIAAIEQIGRAAIADPATTLEKVELAVLRAIRFDAPNVVIPAAEQVTSEVVEAAVCRAGGLANLERHFDARTLEASHRRFRHGVGLLEVLGLAARANGYRGESVKSNLKAALRAAFRDGDDEPGYNARSSAGPSTLNLSGVLSNTANKFLRMGFDAVESTWSRVTAKRNVTDFKTITSYSLTGDNKYVKLSPGGKIKHGTLGSESYTNRAETYARMLSIDRRDWINDDLGAFTQANKRLGRGGALALNEVFWTEFMANAGTFWTSARGNYDDGTDTAFGSAALSRMRAMFTKQTDPDGMPLGLMLAILLVPPGHEFAAQQLIGSSRFSDDSGGGESNPHAGKFRVEVSAYLANSAITGYSELAYYGLANPEDLPVIETAFLNGVESPTVESADADFSSLGVDFRGYHDFGVAKQEYRGGIKFKGEA